MVLHDLNVQAHEAACECLSVQARGPALESNPGRLNLLDVFRAKRLNHGALIRKKLIKRPYRGRCALRDGAHRGAVVAELRDYVGRSP